MKVFAIYCSGMGRGEVFSVTVNTEKEARYIGEQVYGVENVKGVEEILDLDNEEVRIVDEKYKKPIIEKSKK